MSDPIQSSTNTSYYPDVEGATKAENEGQICLSSEHPPPTPQPAAVTALVKRYTPEPSLSKALTDCSGETIGLGLKIAGIAVSAPETFGASLLAAGVLGQAASSLVNCIDASEAKQVELAKRQADAGECQTRGGQAVQSYDGAVVCLKP